MPFFPLKSAIRFGSALLSTTLLLTTSAARSAADTPLQALPFAPEVVSRLSLDGKPRSLAIRQGTDVWLGYDLERGTILKAWRAPPAKPGLIKSGFTTRSTGITWFEDPSDAAWELRRGASTVRLSIRYLGCSHRNDHVELRWELRHSEAQYGGDAPGSDTPDRRTLRLFERVPLAAAPAADRVVRELRVETLSPDEALLPPSTVRKAWRFSTHQDTADRSTIDSNSATPNSAVPALQGKQWHRLTLP
jgi:hypothetical protein